MNRSTTLKVRHVACQLGVQLRTIVPKVRTAMAVRANGSDVSRIVGTAVAQAPNMVRLEVGHARRRHEGRGRLARLALPVRSRQHIVSNGAGAAKNRASCLLRPLLTSRCGVRSFSELIQVSRGFIETVDVVFARGRDFCRHQREHNRIAQSTRRVLLTFELPACTHEEAHEADWRTTSAFLEKEQVSAVCDMIPDGLVAPDHSHVTDLPLPRVAERAVWLPLVAIADPSSAVACEEEDTGSASGRCDTALLLASEDCVDVAAAVVEPVRLKWPFHPRTVDDRRDSSKRS